MDSDAKMEEDAIKNSIAVVGMSCRFPGANSVEEFWETICSGQDAITNFPPNRPIPSNDVEGASKIKAGFLKCPVDEFDANFFGISPREVAFIDPQQRLFLEVTWEALESGGINPQSLKNTKTGVFLGIWQQDYKRYIPEHKLVDNDFFHRFLGNEFSASASRVSYFLDLYGPAVATESGCSSSLSAIHSACESLKKGEISLAIASGVNLILNAKSPFSSDGKSSLVLSKDFKCKTFDESGDGFVRAEGCGVIILKRYNDAIQNNDNILALIRGSSLNNDGKGTSFGTPNPDAQIKVFKEALDNAQVKACEVEYVEAHGTGTVVGDPIEMHSIGQVYSEGRPRDKPLIVSSVKTNIGHCESASGIASVIKMILCLRKSQIPPHLNLKKLNSKIDLESIPAIIPNSLRDWKGDNKLGAVSSFSMSGTNVHMILQEVQTQKFEGDEKMLQLITLSAKSEKALSQICENYTKFLNENKDISLNDLSLTANTGRANLKHRVAILANNREVLLKKLANKDFITSGNSCEEECKIGFLFTGQGSQYFKMGKNLYSSCSAFKEALDKCDELFMRKLKISLLKILWEDEELVETSTYCQPAIFSIEIALFETWKSFGILPNYVLGHSVGEYAAAVGAGVLDLDDAMSLIISRSQLVSSLDTGSMLVLKCSEKEAIKLIDSFNTNSNDPIDIAAINSPEEIVISGSLASIKKFEKECTTKFIRLSSSTAYHSRQMDKVLDKFEKICDGYSFSEPKIKFISCITGKLMEKSDFNSKYWTNHLRNTVNFSKAVEIMANECKVFIEIGSQPILLALTMSNLKELSFKKLFCPSIRKNEDNLQTLFASLANLYTFGININWSRWFCNKGKKLVLPFYPFQRQKFWIDLNDSENILEISTPIQHKLLGRQILTASNSTIFSQIIRRDDFTWLPDHKLADKIIFPASFYLEIFLSAAKQILQTNSKFPLTIENINFEFALEVQERTHIQTLICMKSEPGIKYGITINRQHDQQINKWSQHSSSTYCPSSLFFNLENIKIESVKERLGQMKNLDKVYEKLKKVGIQFGPHFRSIKNAWHNKSELLTLIEQPKNSENFIGHPILLDALIQTYAFKSYIVLDDEDIEMKLFLPVGIKKFVWMSKELTPVMYAHTTGENGNVSLYSDTGTLLAVMEGLEIVKTTPDSLNRILQTNKSLEVPFVTEEWVLKNKINDRFDMENLPSADINNGQTFREESKGIEIASQDNEQFFELNRLCVLYLLRTIIELNFDWPVIGSPLNPQNWKSKIHSNINPLVLNIYLSELEKYGQYIKYDSEKKTYYVQRELPSFVEVEMMIDEKIQCIEKTLTYDEITVGFAQNFGKNFTNVLEGKITGLSLLFPEDKNIIGATRLYTESNWHLSLSSISLALFLDSVASIQKPNLETLRILEVGAGSGASSLQLITKLKELNIPFTYTYTDISPFFIEEAKSKLGNDVEYSTLNIEEDPLTQGFSPGEYDLILGIQVLHSTENIEESLDNINLLLRPNGRLILSEFFRMEPLYALPFSFLDGWWRFKDFRNKYPSLSKDEWHNCLKNTGYKNIVSYDFYKESCGGISATKESYLLNNNVKNTFKKHWIVYTDDSSLCTNIIRKFEEVGRNVIVLNKNLPISNDNDVTKIYNKNTEGIVYFWTKNDYKSIEEAQNHELANIFFILKSHQEYAMKIKQNIKVILVTRGVNYIGDDKIVNPSGATGWGFIKSYINETFETNAKLIDLDAIPSEINADQVFSELWASDSETFVSFRDKNKFVQRLITMDEKITEISLPYTDRYKFIEPQSGAFSDIKIGPDHKFSLDNNEIEILIKATSLNFHDLFMVLKPQGFLITEEEKDTIGLDISGIIASIGPNVKKFRVGDPVFGYTTKGGFKSHLVESENNMMLKPSWMTFVEASTIPCVFLTAYSALVEYSKVQKNDRVLVHVASGGVGLAAIQILKHIGANIFATAGSNRKRNYLKNLGIKHVYNSRNISYGDEIMKDTNWAGVTVVLNSLTGPNFKETTLNVCSLNARFIEIGRLNIWSENDVKRLRPDVDYFIFDFIAFTSEEKVKVFRELQEYINKKIYQGLPATVFPLSQIHNAFYYFQKARHIGKVAISMPVFKTMNEKLELQHEIFNPMSSYLITGGLGGLGIECTKWMLSSGAKYIVLVGRTKPSQKVSEQINKWNEEGAKIVVICTNIEKEENCVSILEQIKKTLPPLRGIIHGAGVLHDDFISRQKWDTIEEVLKPKVYGGWYLHKLTLNIQLEFFIMFSSMAAIFGSPTQSNHAAANRFLDSLAFLRDSLGLPATTINWGAWSDIGAAAHIRMGKEGYGGVSSFTPAQGIYSLSKIMQTPKNQHGVLNVYDWNIVKQVINNFGNYMSNIQTEVENQVLEDDLQNENIVSDIISASAEDKLVKIQKYVESLVRKTLKLPKTEAISIDQNLNELGLDSLMTMELRNKLQLISGEKVLNLSEIQKNFTIRSLSTYIAFTHDSLKRENNVEYSYSTDYILPSDFKVLDYSYTKINHVLLTGVTGHLGIFILSDLLMQSSSLKVTCIIRSSTKTTSHERLKKTLDSYKLNVDMSRVNVVVGDVRLPQLGLDDENYYKLAENVDAICHCAALANHLYPYSDGTFNDIRTNNVLSLANILTFAAEKKTKMFFHASSIVAVTRVEENGILSETWPETDELGDKIKNAYTLSKIFGEKMLKEAESKGLPVICMRYPVLFADSINGIIPSGFNHFWNFLVASTKVRLWPKDPNGIPTMCVDHAAHISVKLLLSPNAERGVYNLISDSIVVTADDILDVFSSLGIEANSVTFKEWAKVVFEMNIETELGSIKEIYKEESGIPIVYHLSPLQAQMINLNLKMSEKLARNVNGAQNILISPKEVIKRNLMNYLNSNRSN